MKQIHGSSLFFGTTAAVLLISQSALAQQSEITGVRIKQVDGGVNLVLKTSSGSRPQVFTTKRGTSLVADIINTQLKLPKGRNSFSEENPVPGISSIVVNQLDANSVRVIVTGSNNVPVSQPVGRARNSITLNFASLAGSTGSNSVANSASTPPNAVSSNQKPLVPNPEISIDNTPAQPAGPGQPSTQAPPFLPRAVAPPVGDMAIANIDASPSVIDLGTQQRVPRLVLRDASVREVLSLLARAAGLNLAYTNGSSKQGEASQDNSGADGPTISLDINDEPVQDVFNYVLRLSGLQANRSGRTIFVGRSLPNSTRDMVMRNVRLNQVSVPVALNFLVGLGAQSAVSRERQVTSVSAVPVGTGAAPITQTQTTTETKIELLRLDGDDNTDKSKYVLGGLQALGDERTNSITLIGEPKLVQVAMAQLTQLDVRRRQVAVNVKVVDIRLSNIKDFDSSFSFGIANNFFSVDGGNASANFGGINPPSSTSFNSGIEPRVTTPTVNGQQLEGEPFLDAQPDAPFGTGTNQQFAIPQAQDGNVQTFPIFDNQGRQIGVGSGAYPRPPFGTNENPFQPGVTDISEDGVSTFSLPTLFQYPKRFLATLQAQVQSGNAKILTDPTLIVQEGQQAQVNLTQEVVGNITREITDTSGSSRETVTVDKERVGLTLGVKVDRVDDNGFVSLSVAPTVSSPSAPVDTGNGQIVLISERSLQSGLIRLRDGQTLILSGIIQDQDRTSVSKVPILGDIPLLGSLFRKTSKTNERNEVIVMLTPQIMDDSQRSSYGYNYNPSPSVRRVLQRRGLKFPKK